MELAVTTTLDPRPAELDDCRSAAARHGLPFLERGKASLEALARRAGAEALLVLSARRAALWLGGTEWPYRPGMGALRAKRLATGERATNDPFLAAARLRAGDRVLDCTLGLGADALVAAAAVGSEGSVVGLEASPALATLVAEGLRRAPIEAARRIEVRRGRHAEVLAAVPDRSFDVVVFDPLFRYARSQEPAFELVRRLGDPAPLSPEALARAQRVARRWVVVKDGAPGWDLARLGLRPLPSARGAKRLYARVEAI